MKYLLFSVARIQYILVPLIYRLVTVVCLQGYLLVLLGSVS